MSDTMDTDFADDADVRDELCREARVQEDADTEENAAQLRLPAYVMHS